MGVRTGIATAVTQDAAQPLSLAARLVTIFYDPTTVMESISVRPAWIGVVVVLTLLSVGVQYAVVDRIGVENIMLQGLKMNPMVANQKSDAELQQMAERAAARGAIMTYSGPAILLWGVIPVTAGLLNLLAMMFGAEISYKKLISLLAHTFWVYSLANSIVLVAVVFLTTDPVTVDLQNAVQTNLGFFLEKAENPVLYSLASSLDLFSFWHLALIALGISVLTGRRWGFGKSLLLPAPLWVVYVAAKTAVTFAFTG